MHRSWCGAGLAVVLLVSACSGGTPPEPAAATQPVVAPAVGQQLDRALDDVLRTCGIPGALVGVWSPQGAYVKTTGVADERTKARIGGESATFTGTAILQLHDQGGLGLDDPIGKYVDGVPNGDLITLRQLGEMRSGLADSGAGTLAAALALPPESEPGKQFGYANVNTVLLGLVVEKVSGEKLGDYLTRHVFTPVGLSGTGYPAAAALPGDAITSTLDDLRKWAPVVATGTLLKPQTQAERLKTQPVPGTNTTYGFALSAAGGWVGHGAGQDGSRPGSETLAVYQASDQATMVVLLTTGTANACPDPTADVGAALSKIVTPAHPYPRPAVQK